MARRRDHVEATLEHVREWPTRDQAALVEDLLTPELRLRLLVQEVRRHVRVSDERTIDRVVGRGVHRVRRARAAAR